MKWVIVAGAVVVALGVLLALVAYAGSRLPRSHRASKEQTFSAAPEAVWLAITDVDAYTSWRKDLTRVERLPDRAGRPAWIEESRSGRLELAMEKMERPRLLLVRVTDPQMRFGGTWTYEIAPLGASPSTPIGAGPSTALGAGPSTALGTGPSTALGAGPSTALGAGPSTALGAGTVVTITENGEVYNPLFRFMAHYVFGHEGTIETYLRQLSERLAAPAA